MVHRLEPGDRVAFRDWDDMESEYRLDDYGDICVRNCGMDKDGNFYVMSDGSYFTRTMRCLCGREFTVRELTRPFGEGVFVELAGFTDGWSITPGMLRLVGVGVNFDVEPSDVVEADFISILAM